MFERYTQNPVQVTAVEITLENMFEVAKILNAKLTVSNYAMMSKPSVSMDIRVDDIPNAKTLTATVGNYVVVTPNEPIRVFRNAGGFKKQFTKVDEHYVHGDYAK